MNSDWWKSQEGEIGSHIKTELDKLIESKQYYPFKKDHEQDAGSWKETYGINKVKYSCYGDLQNNLLYGTMEVNNEIYYGKIKSGLFWPHMRDRLFGMDMQDATWFNWLTDIMCYIYVEGKTFNEVMEIWDRDFKLEQEKRNNK